MSPDQLLHARLLIENAISGLDIAQRQIVMRPPVAGIVAPDI